MPFAPEDHSLEMILDAIAETIDGVHPDLVATAGAPPEGKLVALVRPLVGDETEPQNKCILFQRGTVGIYANLTKCTPEEAYRLVYRLTSGCGKHSIVARLRDKKNQPALRAIGVGLSEVGPAGGYGLAPYNTNEQPNTFHASIAWKASYDNCNKE